MAPLSVLASAVRYATSVLEDRGVRPSNQVMFKAAGLLGLLVGQREEGVPPFYRRARVYLVPSSDPGREYHVELYWRGRYGQGIEGAWCSCEHRSELEDDGAARPVCSHVFTALALARLDGAHFVKRGS